MSGKLCFAFKWGYILIRRIESIKLWTIGLNLPLAQLPSHIYCGSLNSYAVLSGLNISAVKQVVDVFTWTKNIQLGVSERTKLIVRVRRITNHHIINNNSNNGKSNNTYKNNNGDINSNNTYIDVKLFLQMDRAKVSGDGLAAEFLLLKKWAELIFSW